MHVGVKSGWRCHIGPKHSTASNLETRIGPISTGALIMTPPRFVATSAIFAWRLNKGPSTDIPISRGGTTVDYFLFEEFAHILTPCQHLSHKQLCCLAPLNMAMPLACPGKRSGACLMYRRLASPVLAPAQEGTVVLHMRFARAERGKSLAGAVLPTSDKIHASCATRTNANDAKQSTIRRCFPALP
jgi:hypothetical protein